MSKKYIKRVSVTQEFLVVGDSNVMDPKFLDSDVVNPRRYEIESSKVETVTEGWREMTPLEIRLCGIDKPVTRTGIFDR
jgi:hypothetical protein